MPKARTEELTIQCEFQRGDEVKVLTAGRGVVTGIVVAQPAYWVRLEGDAVAYHSPFQEDELKLIRRANYRLIRPRRRSKKRTGRK
jgi:hypothetical protein